MPSSWNDLANSLHPTTPSPALPWEVIERAIDYCSDEKTTLCALALTCSQLHPRSRFFLFVNVDLQTQEQFKKFYDAVQAQPHLQTLVRSLSFPWAGFSPFPLLSNLPGLRHVAFKGDTTVFWVSSQLLPPDLQLVYSVRSLTIRGVRFQTESAFLLFLSAFPNIENLTCERLILLAENPLEKRDRSRRLQLRTLNILQHVNPCVTGLLFQLALRAMNSPLAIGEHTRKDRQTSLTWWRRANTNNVQRAIHFLQQTAIRDITLVFWDYGVGDLYTQCRRLATQELFAAMEKVMLGFHRVLLAVPKGILNARKTISWSDEFSRLLRPLRANWALSEDIQYSGKPGHDASVTSLVISSDGRWVATASDDSTIILWGARDACISQEWIAHDGQVRDLAFSPDSRYIASAGEDRKVAIWDISGSAHQVASLEGHAAPCSKCAWSSDGAYIATRDIDSTLRLWDARTFQLLPLDGAEKKTHVEPLFSPDSRWLLIHKGNASGVWDVIASAYLAFPLHRDIEACFLRAAFSPESAHIAVGYKDGMLHVWNVATGREPLFWQAHENVPIRCVVFSPDGRLLLSTGDNAVKIWDADTGATVQSLEGHEGRVTGACFSPCGKYIASGSNDKTVRVWRTSDGACLTTLSDHGHWVSHVAFTPDGTMLWSAAGNGTVLGRRLQDVLPDEFVED